MRRLNDNGMMEVEGENHSFEQAACSILMTAEAECILSWFMAWLILFIDIGSC